VRRVEKQGPTVAEEVARARELSLGGLFIALGIVIPIAFHALGGGKLGAGLLPMYLPGAGLRDARLRADRGGGWAADARALIGADGHAADPADAAADGRGA
jgi:hypothetical protein